MHLDSQPEWKHEASLLACDVKVDACERTESEDRQEVLQFEVNG